MAPKDIHVLIPGTCEYIGKGEGIKAVDGIKVANHMALR